MMGIMTDEGQFLGTVFYLYGAMLQDPSSRPLRTLPWT